MSSIRPAHENDLFQIQNVFYQNEVRGVETPPPPGNTSPALRHILSTGRMYIAEQDNQIRAFAGAITRSTTTFLTDLFVHPEAQSTGLGKMLLQCALPQDELLHCTMSSTDPRAQALYIRSGMQPKFPNFNLQCVESSLINLPYSPIKVVEGDPADPTFIQWDTEISGRERPMDHAFWRTQQQAVPLWFLRKRKTIGYGYVRLNTGNIWYPEVCTIGPLGVNASENTTDCVLAAINWAGKRANVVRIDVPGFYSCLPTLLTCGFRIMYVELFVSSAPISFFDAQRYISSGSDLL